MTVANLLRNPAKAARVQMRIVRDFADAAGITSVGAAAQQAGAPIKALAAPGADDRPRFSLPVTAGPADAVEQVRHRAPALRHALGVVEQPQAAQGRHRRHAQRRGHGDLRGGLAGVLAAARRAARPAAAGDGAGVDPHGRRGGAVDEPGLRPRRRPADERARPPAAGGSVPRGDERRQAAVRAGPRRGAGRHPAVLVTGRGDVGDPPRRPAAARRPDGAAGERHHLQRPRPASAAVHGWRPAPAVHPRLDDRRGHGPEHHGPQLPRRAGLRSGRAAASWCRTCGTWSTCTSTRSPGCSTPPVPSGPNRLDRRPRATASATCIQRASRRPRRRLGGRRRTVRRRPRSRRRPAPRPPTRRSRPPPPSERPRKTKAAAAKQAPTKAKASAAKRAPRKAKAAAQ